MLLIIIIVVVRYVFLFTVISSRLDKLTMDSHVLETIWTIVPMFILCFIAFPSLYLLYLIEDCREVDMVVKVVGHQ